jgi:exonuclease III
MPEALNLKKFELINYLEANNIPIALISETHLQPSITFKCLYYIIYRSDRIAQQGGGTAILIRRDINHNEFPLPHLQRMEASAIQLTINKELIILVSVYSPQVKLLNGIWTVLLDWVIRSFWQVTSTLSI